MNPAFIPAAAVITLLVVIYDLIPDQWVRLPLKRTKHRIARKIRTYATRN